MSAWRLLENGSTTCEGSSIIGHLPMVPGHSAYVNYLVVVLSRSKCPMSKDPGPPAEAKISSFYNAPWQEAFVAGGAGPWICKKPCMSFVHHGALRSTPKGCCQRLAFPTHARQCTHNATFWWLIFFLFLRFFFLCFASKRQDTHRLAR